MARGTVEAAGGRLSAATVAAVWRFGGSSGTSKVRGRVVEWRVADRRVEVAHFPADPTSSPLAYVVGVALSATPGGGSRWWWTCPGCGSRAGDLYLTPARDRLGCRRCCGLAYASQRTRVRGRKPAGRRMVVEREVACWTAATGWTYTRSTARA